MAKISALTDGDPAVATDHVVVARGAGNFKLLLSALKTLFNTSPTITGAAGFADGTAAAPSIAWTSDQDGTGTGLYRPDANVIGVSTAGTENHRFAASVFWTASLIGVGNTAASPFNYIQGGAANTLRFSQANSTATSRTEINKAVTAFTEATPKAVLTVTIPNAMHSAVLEVEVLGIVGAGGAIGAGEATATNTYKFVITRTAGVNAVMVASSAFGAAAANVAGATTVTATAAASAVSGAVGATNTFTVDVTITTAGGSSDNHTALIYAKLMNANATGITIA